MRLLLLEPSLPPGHPAWSPTLRGESRWWVIPFRAVIFRDLRRMLRSACLRQRRVSCEWIPCIRVQHGPKPFPFGPACQPFGRLCLTTLRIHLCLRSPSSPAQRIAVLAHSLAPLHPCTPTIDNQSHAVGCGFLPSIAGIGVTPI